ncbi:dihydrouridine synthase [candidate division WWE3 bacterium CG10_big_fil_rev_8_21_14_0_10_32_10]|uniref:tRNA-dihydrouridine synthase n=1 Tax=candidate division WWE3 bacterium CG10_big_fil_rev_8_21_14_0_10_32_10 TaxID=1975090 RepID=A0A2H0RBJ7_UNCKA|nr:MAG: dihydrouridine synthase [candidate division WWE3 bacterium CG10_big_fil_rev_8_21_14_0_10_32_10]
MNFWNTIPKPIKALAPMEDVTDTVFRQLLIKWSSANSVIPAQAGIYNIERSPTKSGRTKGPDVMFTEFTNAAGLSSEGKNNVIHRLKYTQVERPIVAQIWGTDANMHYESTKLVKTLGFDGIDINMGCPVKKIIKQGACSALIDNPDLAKELIKATKDGAEGLPISVKTRIGFKNIKTEEWIGFLLAQNLDAITIHGRIAKDMSKNPANWKEIKKAVEIRNKMKKETLIIGNGDITSLKDLKVKCEKYGTDGGMVGRGVFKNVYFFNENINKDNLNMEDKINLLKEHILLYKKTWGKEKDYNILKRFFKIYISNFEGSKELRTKLMQAKSYEEAVKILDCT